MAPTRERMARYRKNLRKNADEWQKLCDEDALRKRYHRANETLDEMEIEERRRQGRERAQKSRNKKIELMKSDNVEEVNTSYLGSYACKQTLLKATKKVRRNLPESPQKQKAVLAKIIQEKFGRELFQFKEKTKSMGRKGLSNDVKKLVTDFYNRDDISWQAPGKRDVVSVKNGETGKRVKMQKRILLLNIREVKIMFDEEHGSNLLKLALFYKLRPKHILPVSKMPHNVCVCVTHANFLFLVKALLSFLVSVDSYKDLMLEACCSLNQEECMLDKCAKCKQFDIRSLVRLDISANINLQVQKWKRVEGRLQVTEYSANLSSVIQEFNKVFPSFKSHSFVKLVQSEYFESKKKSLQQNEAVIQVDYSENASLISQDEIQSAHWCHGQATLFTCVIWVAENVLSYVVISDDLNHSRSSSWLFLKAIISNFRFKYEEIETLHLFSDNCSSQFKSKYTISNLRYLAEDLGVKNVTIDTFAAGHGKGAVDAIGGIVKRSVWLAVKARRKMVRTAAEFFECAQEEVKNVNLIYVTSKDVQNSSEFLAERWKETPKLIGIRKLHHFEKLDKEHIYASKTVSSDKEKFKMTKSPELPVEEAAKKDRLRYSEVYSSSESEDEDSLAEDETLDTDNLSPGVFVQVKLTSQDKRKTTKNFIGIIQSDINEDDYVRVLFLELFSKQSGDVFKINENDDKYIHLNEIVKVLPQPKIFTIGNRILYKCPQALILD